MTKLSLNCQFFVNFSKRQRPLAGRNSSLVATEEYRIFRLYAVECRCGNSALYTAKLRSMEREFKQQNFFSQYETQLYKTYCGSLSGLNLKLFAGGECFVVLKPVMRSRTSGQCETQFYVTEIWSAVENFVEYKLNSRQLCCALQSSNSTLCNRTFSLKHVEA